MYIHRQFSRYKGFFNVSSDTFFSNVCRQFTSIAVKNQNVVIICSMQITDDMIMLIELIC